MRLKSLIYGLAFAAFVPGLNKGSAKGTGGTNSAGYCYSVWLRHLVMARKSGLNSDPKVVAELGPGDSLGIGLAALISGCDKYFAFDVVPHINAGRNLKIFDELVTLFRKKENIPGKDEFPKVKPYLDEYNFPADILDDKRLQRALEKSRLERIRDSLSDLQRNGSPVQYKVPWYDADTLEKESVDMIYSQAVLEHVDDLRNAYKSMRAWLKPDGFMSHQIGFGSHGTADKWNGHWAYSDFMWKLIRGKKAWFLNREPHSTHIAMLAEEGFKVVCEKRVKAPSTLTKNDLAPRFKFMSEDDLITIGAFIQATR